MRSRHRTTLLVAERVVRSKVSSAESKLLLLLLYRH